MTSRLYLREMDVQRKLMPRGSMKRTWSRLVGLVCGYGEKPLRIVGGALAVIVFCAMLYFIFGVYGNNLKLGFSSEYTLSKNVNGFVNCLFYSASAFTSLGFSERAYEGLARFTASMESLVGALSMIFFLVLLARKLFR